VKLVSRDFDEVTGLYTDYLVNGRGQITIQRWHDAEPIIKHNQAELAAKSAKGRVGKYEGLGRKVASIPMGVVEKLAKEGTNLITCSSKDLKKILNDPEYRHLRTAYGRL